jgi:L-asparaginase II
MSGTFLAGAAVELAVVERSGFVESRHVGSAVVVGPEGEMLISLGDPSAPVFPRSCLKPFQALAVLNSGVELDAVQTVLATASHAGTHRHVEVVDSILAKAGLGRDALQCPADWPGDSAARDELVREHANRASIYMNCSGKHAAMLYACQVNGWPTDTYLELGHPLQQDILGTIERLTGETVVATGIDGCGAPIHAVSLTGLARGIGRITAATEGPAATLTASVLTNGWAIDGPGRANTLVIDELHVLAKLGAEGVMVMSVPGVATVALKMLDGSLRAASLVGLTLLVSVGALTQAQLDALLPRLDLTLYGGTTAVGAIRVSATL